MRRGWGCLLSKMSFLVCLCLMSGKLGNVSFQSCQQPTPPPMCIIERLKVFLQNYNLISCGFSFWVGMNLLELALGCLQKIETNVKSSIITRENFYSIVILYAFGSIWANFENEIWQFCFEGNTKFASLEIQLSNFLNYSIHFF